ncbi:MAG: hydrogenase maturation nickel metallochaperone HypA [Gammaproteobacteria bacterium]
MHELSLCESLLEIIEEQARVHHYRRVRTVWLEVGRFAGVECDALRFSFEVVVCESLANGAKLEIIDIPGCGWCFDCGAEVLLEDCFEICPRCGGAVQITGGKEFRLKELEVE